jgi:hypothetical protein
LITKIFAGEFLTSNPLLHTTKAALKLICNWTPIILKNPIETFFSIRKILLCVFDLFRIFLNQNPGFNSIINNFWYIIDILQIQIDGKTIIIGHVFILQHFVCGVGRKQNWNKIAFWKWFVHYFSSYLHDKYSIFL